jgi:hypothetical protein
VQICPVRVDNCLAPAPAIVLGRWHVYGLTPLHDVQFRVTASPPSSFQPPTPGMLVCGGNSQEDLIPFTYAYQGWAVVNGPVPTAAGTWGEVKSLFGR